MVQLDIAHFAAQLLRKENTKFIFHCCNPLLVEERLANGGFKPRSKLSNVEVCVNHVLDYKESAIISVPLLWSTCVVELDELEGTSTTH